MGEWLRAGGWRFRVNALRDIVKLEHGALALVAKGADGAVCDAGHGVVVGIPLKLDVRPAHEGLYCGGLRKGGSMRRNRVMGVVCALVLSVVAVPMFAQAKGAPKTGILHPADLKDALPGQVFFRGLSATTQLRNSGGVRFADGLMMLTALVDNGGYSSGLQKKYQAYLITEVKLDFGGHVLDPGAYGVGFVEGGMGPEFVVMNLAAKDLFYTAAGEDMRMKRPIPLQITPAHEAESYKLYFGRDNVVFSRAK